MLKTLLKHIQLTQPIDYNTNKQLEKTALKHIQCK
jgi:hypothetical protein